MLRFEDSELQEGTANGPRIARLLPNRVYVFFPVPDCHCQHLHCLYCAASAPSDHSPLRQLRVAVVECVEGDGALECDGDDLGGA